SSPSKLHAYDPKINRTFHRLLRNPRSSEVVNNSSLNNSVFAFDFVSCPFVSISASSVDSDFDLANNDRTLKELATLDSYELKSGLIHFFPKFHGLAREDPYKHLKEFYVACSTMRPHGIPEDCIKMKAFPFS
ncbi:hypothetical protein CR513_04147, partial [Mucuna pruriens]